MAIRNRIITIAGLCLSAAAASGEKRLMLGEFSAGRIGDWEMRAFDDIPPTRYRIATIDGRKALRAECHDSASVFGIRRQIDLGRTPVLHWSWQVSNVYSDIDERTKDGDDFAARIYAVVDGGWLKWRTRAINYVWSSATPVGEAWPNPYRDQAMMVAVAQGPPQGDGWRHETANLRESFRRHFDMRPDHIDGIALMSDCDNHGGSAVAHFGDIYLTGE